MEDLSINMFFLQPTSEVLHHRLGGTHLNLDERSLSCVNQQASCMLFLTPLMTCLLCRVVCVCSSTAWFCAPTATNRSVLQRSEGAFCRFSCADLLPNAVRVLKPRAFLMSALVILQYSHPAPPCHGQMKEEKEFQSDTHSYPKQLILNALSVRSGPFWSVLVCSGPFLPS